MGKVQRKVSEETMNRVHDGEIPRAKLDAYYQMLDRIEKEILPHEVIVDNRFTAWFERGELDREDVKHFLVQFSVFSNLFLEAQLKKTINAPSLEAMHSSKEILMNELGVVFRNNKKATTTDEEIEADIVQTEGSVENGSFRFRAAHFEWLLRMTSHLGLGFNDIGKRRHGTSSTLFFCDELSRIYGSDDAHMALGASFAVENWAAAGFWKQLIKGLDAFKKRELPALPLAFFTWHDKVEDQHAQHTWDELEEEFFSMDINQDKFFTGAKEMLHGVHAFWKGLDQDRIKRSPTRHVAG
jgi:pyrroloquinoline quinone (PQQ) biosynthesis protein C